MTTYSYECFYNGLFNQEGQQVSAQGNIFVLTNLVPSRQMFSVRKIVWHFEFENMKIKLKKHFLQYKAWTGNEQKRVGILREAKSRHFQYKQEGIVVTLYEIIVTQQLQNKSQYKYTNDGYSLFFNTSRFVNSLLIVSTRNQNADEQVYVLVSLKPVEILSGLAIHIATLQMLKDHHQTYYAHRCLVNKVFYLKNLEITIHKYYDKSTVREDERKYRQYKRWTKTYFL